MQEIPRDDSYHRIIKNEPKYRFEFGKFLCRILHRDDNVEDVQNLPVEAHQFVDKMRKGDILLSVKTKNSNLLLLVVEAQSKFSPMMHERMHIYATLTQFHSMESLYAQCVKDLHEEEHIPYDESASCDCLHPKRRAAVDRMYAQLPQMHMVLINSSPWDWRKHCFPKTTKLESQPIDVMSYEEYRRHFARSYNTDLVPGLNFNLIIINMVELAAVLSTANTEPIGIYLNKEIHHCSAEDLRFLYQYATYYLATSKEDKMQYLHDVIGLEKSRADQIAAYDFEQFDPYQSGLADGEARGEARGRIEGEARGRIEGEARGEARTTREIAARMKRAGVDLGLIETITKLTRQEILAL